jgi:hypothetical protein
MSRHSVKIELSDLAILVSDAHTPAAIVSRRLVECFSRKLWVIPCGSLNAFLSDWDRCVRDRDETRHPAKKGFQTLQSNGTVESPERATFAPASREFGWLYLRVVG